MKVQFLDDFLVGFRNERPTDRRSGIWRQPRREYF